MSHKTTQAFAHTSGPKDAPVVLVGEAWGEQEDLTGLPFMGQSGQELTRLLGEAGLRRRDCLLTNVFPLRPVNNSIAQLCGKKAEVGAGYTVAPLSMGQYVLPEYLGEVNRLREEVLASPRNLVVALGSVACWALLGRPGIGALRGTTAASTLCPGVKVLPTYHPSYLFKMWENRPIVLADLLKAERESRFPDIRRPERYVLVNPTLEEIHEWVNQHIRYIEPEYLSVDVETSSGQITMIGVAVSAKHAMVIPFVDTKHPSGSYWPTLAVELEVWNLVAALMKLSCPKIFQNGLYDLQYIVPVVGQVRNATEDTMLLHHALYPELQKGLGFLGSIYTNESSWKLLRTETHEEKGDKRDE